jgi:CPA1 family monovalent cation:H+ antiporter
MLFAGAIHIKFKDLNNEKLSILLFSTISVLISIVYHRFSLLFIKFHGIPVQLIHAMLFDP